MFRWLQLSVALSASKLQFVIKFLSEQLEDEKFGKWAKIDIRSYQQQLGSLVGLKILSYYSFINGTTGIPFIYLSVPPHYLVMISPYNFSSLFPSAVTSAPSPFTPCTGVIYERALRVSLLRSFFNLDGKSKKATTRAANALFCGLVFGFIFSFLFAYSGVFDEGDNLSYSVHEFMAK